MSYYRKVLQPNEVVRYVGQLHWIIYKNAMILACLACVLTAVSMFLPPEQRSVLEVAALILAGLAALSFGRAWFVRVTSEIVVTDMRIIHKVGWIARQTEEMNVSKVETVDVSQSVAGRVFGYGTILMRGIGGSWEPLRFVASPLELRNAIMVG